MRRPVCGFPRRHAELSWRLYGIEPLESRRLLDCSFNHATGVLTGTGNDLAHISFSSPNGTDSALYCNGFLVALSAATTLTFNAGPNSQLGISDFPNPEHRDYRFTELGMIRYDVSGINQVVFYNNVPLVTLQTGAGNNRAIISSNAATLQGMPLIHWIGGGGNDTMELDDSATGSVRTYVLTEIGLHVPEIGRDVALYGSDVENVELRTGGASDEVRLVTNVGPLGNRQFTLRAAGAATDRLTLNDLNNTLGTDYVVHSSAAKTGSVAIPLSMFAVAFDRIHSVELFGNLGSSLDVSAYNPLHFDLIPHLQDHGNNSQTATNVGAHSVTPGAIDPVGDADWFRFVAAQGAQITLETSLGTLVDSTLTLYAADGQTVLAFNDDISVPSNLASRITYNIPTTGVYFAAVRGFSNHTGTYTLNFTHVDDHGDRATSATVMNGLFTHGGVEVSGDADYFRFSAIAGQQYHLRTTLFGLSDSTLTLYDTNGTTILAYNDNDGTSLASHISWTAPASGDFYVAVRGYNHSNVGTYRVWAVPTVLVADTLVDEYDGMYSVGGRSLRETIVLANDPQWEIERIEFSPALNNGTIELTLGELWIQRPVQIVGPGAHLLTIDASGNDPTPLVNNGDGSRVFLVDDENPGGQIQVEISGLTVTGGDVAADAQGISGGGINNSEALVLRDMVIRNNHTQGSGGGVRTHRIGSVSLIRCTIENNSAWLNGGGVSQNQGVVDVVDSTISSNQAIGPDSNGGGLSNFHGLMRIHNSTVSGNTSHLLGGGIATISFDAPPGTLQTRIDRSTITENSSFMNFGNGIGVRNVQFHVTTDIQVYSSIISGNIGTEEVYVDVALGDFFHSLGYNVVGVGAAVGNLFNQPGDQVGVTNAGLMPLAQNGGPTRTHALMATSPPRNAGNPADAPGINGIPAFDQRGNPYSRVAGGRIDIGAFELQSTTPNGDFNNDGVFNLLDIDALVMEIVAGSHNPLFDMTGDSLVNLADRDRWLAVAGAVNLPSGNPYRLGDANLDGVVDGSDFGIWNSHKFTAAAGWSRGDFNADGVVDGSDFGIWNSNKFTTSDARGATTNGTVPFLDSRSVLGTHTHHGSARSIDKNSTIVFEYRRHLENVDLIFAAGNLHTRSEHHRKDTDLAMAK